MMMGVFLVVCSVMSNLLEQAISSDSGDRAQRAQIIGKWLQTAARFLAE